MHDKQDIECNLIVDEDFMNKDVSELVQGDFYLFCVKEDNIGSKTYLYKDGRVGVVYFDTKGNEGYYSATYTEGTLQEYVDNLLTKSGDNNV